MINDTLYHERARLLHAKDDDRVRADRAYYARLGHELPHASAERQRALVREIVTRYVDEITGHFAPRVYDFTTRVLPYGLSAIMQGFSLRGLLGELRGSSRLDEHLLLEGEVEALVQLADRGTIILVPTHSSNLDSLLVGYAIFRMGLPHFVYGAGLNLFTNPLTSFFMHNLGAYTVDRRKSDPLYRETLKEYATISLEAGQHNLFFPGGTRSRSGEIETRIKLGLLGAGLAAYRNNVNSGAQRHERIFIVPCTISYPLVLEAASLVRDFLEETGRSQYIIVEDEFSRIHRWVDFLRGLAKLELRVHLRFGSALDPFGDDVDREGGSHDPRGRSVDPSRYLLRDGHVVTDPARDAEYTRALGERIVANYHRDNVALVTNVLAFSLLELLRRDLCQPDLFRMLRTIGPDNGIAVERVEAEVATMLEQLRGLEREGKIHLDEGLGASAGDVVARGLEGLGTYHATPVALRRGAQIVVLDADLLFYYRNRLEGYGLLGAPRLCAARSGR
ncbi:MAG: 1-acyl-sn-glycerol-3-phosphate acyltransferase [Kofleriaceae bacterium]|nr:1-acyl-sn-glycerol-3-phosphate acyltransferase [Kofleriaceae bacterium]